MLSGFGHAHLGYVIYVVPAASFVFGVIMGLFTVPRLTRGRVLAMVAVGALTLLMSRISVWRISTSMDLPLVVGLFVFFALMMYLPFQAGQLGTSYLVRRIRGRAAHRHRPRNDGSRSR
jgi:hypothetical protein